MIPNYADEYHFIRYLIDTLDDNLPEYIYHYTNWEATKNIIEEGLLWSTNIAYLNDRSELKHSRKIIANIIKRRIGNENIKCKNDYLSELLDKILGRKNYGVYIVSFSSIADDLNQWKSYSKSPIGICIKFKTSHLLSRLWVPIIGHNVVYNNSHKEKIINNIIDYLLNQVPKDDSVKKDNYCSLLELGKLYLEFITPLFKDSDWTAENEFRIITTPREMPFAKIIKFKKEGVRGGEKINIPYIKIPIINPYLPDQNRLPIESIIVLTNKKYNDVKNEIVETLKVNNDTYIKILKSKSTYRYLKSS